MEPSEAARLIEQVHVLAQSIDALDRRTRELEGCLTNPPKPAAGTPCTCTCGRDEDFPHAKTCPRAAPAQAAPKPVTFTGALAQTLAVTCTCGAASTEDDPHAKSCPLAPERLLEGVMTIRRRCEHLEDLREHLEGVAGTLVKERTTAQQQTEVLRSDTKDRIEGLENELRDANRWANTCEKDAREQAHKVERLSGSIADDLRTAGWLVAVHNDYVQAGERFTFWLLTHAASGRFVKGEGHSDAEALCAIRAKLKVLPDVLTSVAGR